MGEIDILNASEFDRIRLLADAPDPRIPGIGEDPE
jgi:hypothetical protein